jgi:hypothetical protein
VFDYAKDDEEVVVDGYSDFHVDILWNLLDGKFRATIGKATPYALFQLEGGPAFRIFFKGKAKIWYRNDNSTSISLQTFKGPDKIRYYSIYHDSTVSWSIIESVDQNGAPQTVFFVSKGKPDYFSVAPLDGPSKSNVVALS